MNSDKPIDICKHCPYTHSCKVHNGVLSKLPKTIVCPEKGDHLFKSEEAFTALYVLCQGSAKATLSDGTSMEKIVQFYHPGDMIGLCAFGNESYQESVEILSYSRVFKIERATFENALAESSALANGMISLLSENLVRRQRNHSSNTLLEAESRLIRFLQDQQVWSASTPSKGSFELCMSRVDIANYLGIAVETLSRLMKKLTQKGLIEAQNRRIAIRNLDFSSM
ncbi:Crp/Fnr family transcriptional regulator [Lacimicrobium sp. SS2-24]|uniref:Crp/Fnr family transcriptional regulator n=1 Tax=Lacimicrobium sp. SS2-24 TaxID=2005569 RepID=UPI000B4B20DA|nr:Crp/Fnr family transcriptional regulator [Lacimicrobium sp. SS2-24]